MLAAITRAQKPTRHAAPWRHVLSAVHAHIRRLRSLLIYKPFMHPCRDVNSPGMHPVPWLTLAK